MLSLTSKLLCPTSINILKNIEVEGSKYYIKVGIVKQLYDLTSRHLYWNYKIQESNKSLHIEILSCEIKQIWIWSFFTGNYAN